MMSPSGPSSSNGNPMGTPSKNKYYNVEGTTTTASNSATSMESPYHVHGQQQTNTVWKTLRWVLLGFGIGASSMALFQSINMPTIRVEFEYDQGPPALHHYQLQQQQHKEAFFFTPNTNNNNDKIQKHKQQPQHKPQPKLQLQEEEEEDKTDREEEQSTNDKTPEEGQEGPAEEPNDKEENENFINEGEDAAIANDDMEVVKTEEEEIAHKTTKKHKKTAKHDKLGTMKLIKGEMQVEEDDPDFSNPGPPPELEPGEAFAACILIKDDNHWLIEWLAYHWHTMPLRYLVVAVDPDSKTSPVPILKRWKDRKLMAISIWNDTMFMPKKVKANATMFHNNTDLMMHRVRQNNFYFKCMRTFKQRNREWLMLIDTDEYIVNNYASGLYYNITKHIPITKPGNVLTFIKQHHMLTGENHTCSYMPRYMFGIKESENSLVQKHMPKGFDGMDFMTQRFQFRNPKRMHNGKNLINIKKLPQIKTYTSVHHVSSYCPDPDKMRSVNHVKKALLRVHHYLGTEEQYFFRTDPRTVKETNDTNAVQPPKAKKKADGSVAVAYFTRGIGRYKMLNRGAIYPDQGARAWIKGFIQDVGLDLAKELLAGVGKVGYE
ncbi:expressed unknown protein [Seminavis robusta]|uniref:Uncharacterized protein n=1 Tax=Seminavis robusta TaxID=568900 RepID=A0A9N8HAP3_9STRA|nr:expressed unknown protein [Seminavis robusta]|eukprot:Sro304_g112580.1 n/a (604) ;mRNA; r:34734-36906